ncbi:multiple coagulation factor deficiency protein 2 homolog [Euwallacea similis]|uniref:multiple coagulation factor deficiency protein 2 homolog n=1 Tax=Euwallacea similis TaxID=1736056 RepID=UPI00344B4016
MMMFVNLNMNYIGLILTLLLYLMPKSWARGPHHPRGSSITKRHVHYTPERNSEKITQDTKLLQDKQHIQEHLEEMLPKVDLSKKTEAELELYYFLLHDTDKNSKLDGLELLNAILHTTHEEDHDSNDISAMPRSDEEDSVDEKTFNRFVDLVDQVLKEDDKNQDGYLDYAEYVEGRKKTERAAERQSTVG